MVNDDIPTPANFEVDSPDLSLKFFREFGNYLGKVIRGEIEIIDSVPPTPISVTRQRVKGIGDTISIEIGAFWILCYNCYNRGERAVFKQIDEAYRQNRIKAISDVLPVVEALFSKHNDSLKLSEMSKYFKNLSKSRGIKTHTDFRLSEWEKDKLKKVLSGCIRFQSGKKKGKFNLRDVSRKAKKEFPHGINGRKLDDKYVKDLLSVNRII